jgi:hypothetical protein
MLGPLADFLTRTPDATGTFRQGQLLISQSSKNVVARRDACKTAISYA